LASDGGNLDVDLGYGTSSITAIKGLATIASDATISGHVILAGNQKEIRFSDGDGSHYVGFKSPQQVINSKIWQLPNDDGIANQALATDGGLNLSWKSYLLASDMQKAQRSITAVVAAGTRLDSHNTKFAVNCNLGDTIDLFNRSEVFVNGQLLMSGSEADRVASTADYHMEVMPLAASSVTFGVTDGDAANGMTGAQSLHIESTDGTKRQYFVSDTANGGVAHLGAVVNGATLGNGVVAALSGGFTGVSVGFELGLGASTQNAFLVLLKAAIEHANGHNGKIIVGGVPGVANGAQSMTMTQNNSGAAGNKSGSNTIANTTNSGAAVAFAAGSDASISPKLSFDLEIEDIVTVISR